MILCSQCGAFCDCDEYPEGFYRVDENGNETLSDDYRCVTCNERE